MVSAMMNSHIASFLVGIENGVPAIRPAGCPSMVKSASLTAPPTCCPLKLHPKQQKQIQPENVHEMPVSRGRIQRAPSQDGFPELTDDIDQPAQSSQDMQRMGGSEHIEKGTAWIRGQVESPGAQLKPGHVLAR